MSKKSREELGEVRVDVLTHQPRQQSNIVNSNRNIVPAGSEFVYVNPTFVASTHSVRMPDQRRRIEVPAQTSVVLEQYWACSKWTLVQRLLAISVAVLLGTVIGLVITVVLNKGSPSDLVGGGFFNNFRSAPG
ncbi:hypothetical protein evm_006949 [Chilo suppressalis]|nr:hypothetical protein evm_006949 [Chilo suppressalis]